MMDKDKILCKVLGERYEELKDLASKIYDAIVEEKESKNFGTDIKNSLTALDKTTQMLYGHTFNYYTGADRHRDIADTRMMLCYILRNEVGFTLPKIGSILKRNHATILHNITTCSNAIAYDGEFERKYINFHETYKNFLLC